jgi:hypothetical protein
MSIKFPRPDASRAEAWTRRGFVGAGLSLPFLSACSSDPNSETAAMYKMALQSWDSLNGGDSITRKQAAAVPYSSIGVRVGSSAQVILVLATQSHIACLWASAAHVAIETQSGRITRTAGLPHNMSQSLFSGSDPLQSGAMAGTTFEYVADVPDLEIYEAPVRYVMESPKPDEIVILGAKLHVLNLREHGSCSVLGWEFDNQYWADGKNGFVWRSIQTVHPSLDPIEIEVFRPPA